MFIREKINNKRRKERANGYIKPISLLPFSPYFKETTFSPQMEGLGRNDLNPTKIFPPHFPNQTHEF